MKEIVHKAFWDRLEAELNEDPPVYEYAIRLVEEIKEVSEVYIKYHITHFKWKQRIVSNISRDKE